MATAKPRGNAAKTRVPTILSFSQMVLQSKFVDTGKQDLGFSMEKVIHAMYRSMCHWEKSRL